MNTITWTPNLAGPNRIGTDIHRLMQYHLELFQLGQRHDKLLVLWDNSAAPPILMWYLHQDAFQLAEAVADVVGAHSIEAAIEQGLFPVPPYHPVMSM